MKNFFILVTVALSGCAALPPELSDSQRDMSFRKGEFRLSCSALGCAGRWGANRRTAKLFHDSGQWEQLADLVAKISYDSDLSYFFLGSAAMGLGYGDASKVYFTKSLNHQKKCSGTVDVCSGFDIPELSQQALNRLMSSIPPVAQAPRQAEPVAQGSLQSALPPCDANVAATSWRNCQAAFTFASSSTYFGEWRIRRPNGQGTGTDATSGEKYVGERQMGSKPRARDTDQVDLYGGHASGA